MKKLYHQLKKLSNVKKRELHPLTHQIHHKHNISKKSLLYIKEYGPHTNVPKNIIRESVKILLFASLFSSLGGLALEEIKVLFLAIMPLIILLPLLNGLIGNYGTIISSKFTTMLYLHKIGKKPNGILKRLFLQLMVIAILTTIISVSIALVISFYSGFGLTKLIVQKIFIICLIDVTVLVGLLFFIITYMGFYFYEKKEDPDNFLIPIATSIADFGNMMLLMVLVKLFFY